MRRGTRGRNVEWLQIKLNTVTPSYLPVLSADGIFGSKTDARVREFQKLSRLKVDGIAGSNTLAKLKTAPTAFGPALPPNYNPKNPPEPSPGVNSDITPSRPRKPGSPNVPRKLTKTDIKDIQIKTHGRWQVGAFGTAEVGKVFLGPDGRRLLYEVYPGAAVYQIVRGKQDKVGRFYAQTKLGFKSDIETYVRASGAKGAAGMKKLADFEVALLLGMASATGKPVFLAITGMQIVRFVLTNHRNFEKYKRAIIVILKTRNILKTHAPTLYKKLLWEAFLAILPNIPESATSNPKIVGSAIGNLIVKFGKAALEQRFRSLGTVFTILVQVALGALKGIPGAAKKALETEPAKIMVNLQKGNLRITKQEAEQIVKEVQANPRALKSALEELRHALGKV
ncbi:MAG: peptidoglycan-binding protein [Pyrinomonadaceae bacterium]|nr:peptidoglycan-binding protein [Pyrinomonadaceae bacterium]